MENRHPQLPAEIADLVGQSTGGSVQEVAVVQTLWSGYGYILRCRLRGGRYDSVVVKHVRWPTAVKHPTGWNSSHSHERKVRSYEVETAWYRDFAQRCGDACRVPQCLAATSLGDGVALVLEDLDTVGFDARRMRVGDAELQACLNWLAEFHATFMGTVPDGLWEVGTYWHLATRPDEWDVLQDGPLKRSAAELDRRLSTCRFQTLVHGDAKVANFCFGAAHAGQPEVAVAAVDFQYVGGGCGIKDVAYLISSCLDEDEAQQREAVLLDHYFASLTQALEAQRIDVDAAAVCEQWRALYPVAWTDFYRFLKGWSPGHWKIHRYSERLARQVLESL